MITNRLWPLDHEHTIHPSQKRQWAVRVTLDMVMPYPAVSRLFAARDVHGCLRYFLGYFLGGRRVGFDEQTSCGDHNMIDYAIVKQLLSVWRSAERMRTVSG